MIAEARKKEVYDRLAARDILQFLRDEAEAGTRYHLVLAADALPYVADIAPIATAVARVLEHIQFPWKLNMLQLSSVCRIFERKTGFHFS